MKRAEIIVAVKIALDNEYHDINSILNDWEIQNVLPILIRNKVVIKTNNDKYAISKQYESLDKSILSLFNVLDSISSIKIDE